VGALIMTLKMIVSSLGFLWFFSMIALSTYVIRTKLDRIEPYLKNSVVLVNTGSLWTSQSATHRAMRCCLIGIVLLFQQHAIRRGLVTEQEIEPIPASLKRWLKAPLYLELPFLFVGMLAWLSHPFR